MWWLIIVGALLCCVSVFLLTENKAVYWTLLKIIFFPIPITMWIARDIAKDWEKRKRKKEHAEKTRDKQQREIEGMVRRVQQYGIKYRDDK